MNIEEFMTNKMQDLYWLTSDKYIKNIVNCKYLSIIPIESVKH